MNPKAKIMIPAIAVGILAVSSFFAVSFAKAENENGFSSLAEKIAAKFNLKADDVKQFFEDERKNREEEMKTKMEDRWNQVVSDGILTESQRDALRAKMEEMRPQKPDKNSKPEDLKNMTEEQRKAKMEEMKSAREKQSTELENWAKENGIDLEKVMAIIHPGNEKGRGPGGSGGPLGPEGNCGKSK